MVEIWKRWTNGDEWGSFVKKMLGIGSLGSLIGSGSVNACLRMKGREMLKKKGEKSELELNCPYRVGQLSISRQVTDNQPNPCRFHFQKLASCQEGRR